MLSTHLLNSNPTPNHLLFLPSPTTSSSFISLPSKHVLIELYQDGTQISDMLDSMTTASGSAGATTATNTVLNDAKMRRDVALEGRYLTLTLTLTLCEDAKRRGVRG